MHRERHRARLRGRASLAAIATHVLMGLAACTSFDGVSVIEPADTEAGPPSVDGRFGDGRAPERDGSLVDDADASDARTEDALAASTPPCNGVAACPRYVFATSDLYSGEDLGGAIAADQKCGLRASLATTLPILLGRSWRAWISDKNANLSASARMTHGTMPYRLPTGLLIANDWTQLNSGDLLHAIDQDEQGTILGADYVWTGTTVFGQVTLDNCADWTIGGIMGTVGRTSDKASTWTNTGSLSCGQAHRLYCFEQ